MATRSNLLSAEKGKGQVVTAGRTPVRDLVAKYLPYLLRGKNDGH